MDSIDFFTILIRMLYILRIYKLCQGLLCGKFLQMRKLVNHFVFHMFFREDHFNRFFNTILSTCIFNTRAQDLCSIYGHMRGNSDQNIKNVNNSINS